MAKEYKIVQQNGLDYVEVRCPCGAVLRGQKVSEMKVSQRIACPVCKREWTATIPATNGLESVTSC
jgi:hypothetical protein